MQSPQTAETGVFCWATFGSSVGRIRVAWGVSFIHGMAGWQEDLSRVRTLHSARVLGLIRRVILSLANAAVDKARTQNLKTKFNT